MNDKAVLIVVRDFLPYYGTLGGVIRILKLAEFLERQGMTVHLVAAGGNEVDYFGYRESVERLNVHYVPDALQRHNTRHARASADTGGRNRPGPLRRWARETIFELAVPDLGVLFFGGLLRKSQQLIDRYGIENVIVSSPPFSTQAVGWMLKRRYKGSINLLVDYRDSWNTLSIFAKRWPMTRALNRFMERRVLANADHLLYQSPPVIAKVEKMFPDTVRSSVLMMNGYDPEMELPNDLPEARNAMLTIGHFGAISDDPKGFRNPAPILQMAADLDLPIRFEFYGPARLSSRWQDLLGERFVLGGNLSHEQALHKMAQIDVLMLIHSDPVGADEVIPAKIFEYMLVGRPILVAGPVDMESARMVATRNLGYTIDILDRDDIERSLIRMLSNWEDGGLVEYDRSTLGEYSRSEQYSKIIPLLR